MQMRKIQKLIAIALVALLALSLAVSCGKKESDGPSDDPLLGNWLAATVEIFGDESAAEEVFDGGFVIELKAGGKCELRVDGDTDKYTWAKKGDTVVISAGKIEFITARIDGPLMLIDDFMDLGMKIVLVKEGASINLPKPTEDPEETDPEETEPEPLDAAGVWNGSWYGYFWISESWGTSWDDWEDYYDDAFLTIDVDDDGVGTMEIFAGGIVDHLIFADITASDMHFEVTNGEFLDMEVDPSDWWFALSPTNEGKLLVISDTYIDPDGGDTGGFSFMFRFRPWGELWIEEEDEGGDLPPNYASYLGMLEEGDYEGSGDDEPPFEIEAEPFYTKQELEIIHDRVSEAWKDFSLREMNYEAVRDEFFNGIEGRFYQGEVADIYYWDAIDGDDAWVRVDFEDIGKDEKMGVGVMKFLP